MAQEDRQRERHRALTICANIADTIVAEGEWPASIAPGEMDGDIILAAPAGDWFAPGSAYLWHCRANGADGDDCVRRGAPAGQHGGYRDDHLLQVSY